MHSLWELVRERGHRMVPSVLEHLAWGKSDSDYCYRINWCLFGSSGNLARHYKPLSSGCQQICRQRHSTSARLALLPYQKSLADASYLHRLSAQHYRSWSDRNYCSIRIAWWSESISKDGLILSHLDPSVLSFMKENHLLPLYVPACCTDVIQECDTTVANRPFKVAMKDAYRDYIHHIYTEWVAANPNYRDLIFYPKLTMGVMKPQLPDFIAAGLRHLGRPPLPRLSRRRSLKTDILLPCAAKSVIWLLQLH